MRLGRPLLILWLVLALGVLLAPFFLHLALLDSLRLPVILASLAVAVFQFWQRQWRTGGLSLLLVLCLIGPWAGTGGLPVPQDMKQVKLIVLPSSDPEALDYALKEQPDLLFIPDFSDETDTALGVQRVIHADPLAVPQLAEALPQLTQLYRPWLLKTNDGMGLFIKAGATDIDSVRVREARVGSYALVADVRLADTELTLAMVHFTRPYPLSGFGRQVAQVERLAGQLQKIPRPIILAGDFNALPWSKILDTLSAAMGADNAQWTGTFPAGSPLKLAIDQVRVSGGLQIVSLASGPYVGSIHLPLVATIALPPR
ncbi:endonuclease/exonuclease/phosphatase family protein [Dongia rigui]|nr:endonuclease/exonuclease/phosphatase family protein [Dongia rigui]